MFFVSCSFLASPVKLRQQCCSPSPRPHTSSSIPWQYILKWKTLRTEHRHSAKRTYCMLIMGKNLQLCWEKLFDDSNLSMSCIVYIHFSILRLKTKFLNTLHLLYFYLRNSRRFLRSFNSGMFVFVWRMRFASLYLQTWLWAKLINNITKSLKYKRHLLKGQIFWVALTISPLFCWILAEIFWCHKIG